MIGGDTGRWLFWRRVFAWRNWERAGLFAFWLVLVAASALGYWGRDDWRLDLFANFRLQYYLAALILCVAAAWRGFKILLGLFALVLLWNAAEIFNFTPRSTLPGPPVYRALSANVHSENTHPAALEAWIRQQEPDFVALIEVTGPWLPAMERLRDILPYQQHLIWGGFPDNVFGSALLSRHPIQEQHGPRLYAGTGSIPVEINTPDGPLFVILCHPSSPVDERAWGWRATTLKDIARLTRQQSERTPVLALGDFNTTPWSPFFRDFVRQSGLQPPDTNILPRRTWPARNPLLWIPIDHFFLSEDLAAQAQWTGPDVGSDHFPIGLDFQFGQMQ